MSRFVVLAWLGGVAAGCAPPKSFSHVLPEDAEVAAAGDATEEVGDGSATDDAGDAPSPAPDVPDAGDGGPDAADADGEGASDGGDAIDGGPDAPDGVEETCADPGPCESAGTWRCLPDGRAVECEVDAGSGCLVAKAPIDCDDGDACDGLEVCSSPGGCQDGEAPVCGDGLPCNGVETCVPAEGCVAGTAPAGCCASDADCDDGDPCNGGGQCALATGTCVLVPAPDCDDGEPCNGKESCVRGALGCVAGAPVACSDGDACNGVESCKAGLGCEPGAPLACDDGLPCNGLESCDPEDGCVLGQPATGCCSSKADCEDGNACNGIGDCQSGTCAIGAPLACDDENPCDGTLSCVPGVGCAPGPALACDDGNPCSGEESCDPVQGCLHGTTLVCNDGKACNGLETCSAAKGCVAGIAPACDDGDLCNGLEKCGQETGCVGGADLECADGDACNGDEGCDPDLGCTPGTSLECSDGKACNGLETCVSPSGCAAGEAPACDDVDACTEDACEDGEGCVHTPVDCDDGDPCTTEGCDAATGCTHTPLGCDDGDACTEGDGCEDGSCVPGAAAVCDDADPCTTDGCDPASGCTVSPAEGPCDDGDACTEGDACVDGACAPGAPASCDDANPCTDETCDAADGCLSAPNEAGCDDGDPCTGLDHCEGGECSSGAAEIDRTFGGASDDQALGVVALPDGGLALGGYTLSTGAGGYDFLLVRTDAAGETVFEKTYGGAGDDGGHAIAAPPDGGFVLAGSTTSKGAGGVDAWVVHTDADGEPIWDATFGGAGDDNAFAIVAGGAGGFAVAGTTTSAGAGGTDAWLVLVDANGSGVAEGTFGGAGDDEASAIAAVPGGGFVLAGSTPTEGGGRAVWLARTDAGGAPVWQRTYAGPGIDLGRAVAVLPDGGLVVAGRSSATPTSDFDALLLRTDSEGESVWSKAFGGTSDDGLHSIVALPAGFVLAGATRSAGAGGSEFYFVRADAGGEVVWGGVFGGEGDEAAYGLALDAGGRLAMAGSTTSKGAGDADVWLVSVTDASPCADDDVCDGAEECLEGACSVSIPLDCDDGDDCTADLCNEGAGCQSLPLSGGEPCDDGDACTVEDGCFGGQCDSFTPSDCDDGETCTEDGCEPGSGCTTTALDVSCDDGDACTEGDVCEDGQCASGAAIDCDDGEDCTTDSCDVGSGCVHADLDGGETCEDGDACTEGDGCEDGACAPGEAADCDDGNLCTDDGCEPSTGCSNLANDAPCDDGEPCNVDDRCVDGQCGAGPVALDVAYGGAGYDWFATVALHPQGGYVLGGETRSKGDVKGDAWVIRTGAAGEVLWEKTYGGAEGENVTDFITKTNGNIVFSATTGSKGDTAGDGWIVRLDPEGEVLGEDVYGSGSLEYLNGMAPLSGGHVAGAGTTTRNGAQDFWVFRVDAGTNVVWDRTYGTPKTDTASAVVALPDDGLAVLGRSDRGEGEVVYRWWLVRTDPDGEPLWDRVIGEPGEPTDLARFSDGGFLLTGNFGSDAGLVRTDDEGRVLWERKLGGAGTDEGLAVRPYGGGALVAGNTGSSGAGGRDGWIVRVDGAGNVAWEETFGGAGNDWLTDLAVLPGVGVAAAGFTTSKGGGLEDGWLVVTSDHAPCGDGDPCTGQEECQGGACELAIADACDDGNECTLDGCAPGPGCTHAPATGPDACDDGDACTTGDACAGAACLAGGAPDCDDGEVCTDDGCDVASGCTHDPNALPCDDGEPCGLADLCAGGACQGGPVERDSPFGSAQSDAARAAVALPGGGVALAGGKVLPTGNADLWLAEVDGSGDLVWEKNFGGPDLESAYSLAVVDGGGFAAAGFTKSEGAGGTDVWLVRTDANGDALFDVAFGGAGDDEARAVLALADGGFALAGSTGSKGAGGTDVWVLRTDAAGSLVWERTLGGGADEHGYGLAPLADGGFAVVGATFGGPSSDLWAARLDAGGGTTWEKTLGGPDHDHALDVEALPGGGLAIAGWTGNVPAGGRDFWLVRTDGDGEVLWDRTYGGVALDEARSLVSLPAGGFVLAGYTKSKGAGSEDFWLVRTDDAGEPVWDRTLGGPSTDDAEEVVVLDAGGLGVAGITYSKGAGSSDAWLVLTSDTTSCADGQICNGAEECQAGACSVSVGLVCDDGNPCTDELCDDEGGCVSVPNSAPCEDADPCTVSDTCVDGSCETGPVEIDRKLGGSQGEQFEEVVALSDGGFAMAGFTYSKGNGGADFWFVRTDAAGNAIAERTYGYAQEDIAYAIAEVSGTGFAIAGFAIPTDEPSEAAWVLRTDEDGDLLWERKYGAVDAHDNARDVVALPDGGLAISGMTKSKGLGAFDGWLVRTDADGDLLWDRTFGSPGTDYFVSLDVLADGGFVLSGTTDGAGTADLWVVRTEADGDMVWQRTVGGSKDEVGWAVASLPGDGIAVAGYTFSKGAGGHDAYLVRLDDAGDLLFDRTYGNGGYDDFYAIVPMPDGGFALAGQTEAFGASPNDLWLLRTDAEGDVLWDRTMGGAPHEERGLDLALLPGGGLALVGAYYTNGAANGNGWLLVLSDGAPCSDGEPCSGEEECLEGLCAAPVALDCDDGNDCTADSCVTGAGCASAPLSSGTCDDGDPCTGDGTCEGGSCLGASTGFEVTFDHEAANHAAAYDIVALSDGGVAVAGQDPKPGGGFDMLHARLGPEGDVIFEKAYGGNGTEVANALATTSEGGFVLAGSTTSKGAGLDDAWLVRTDADGALVWDRTYGGANYDYFQAVVAMPDGGFALGGHTASKGAGSYDGWLVLTDSEGEPLLDATFGGTGTDFGLDLVSLPDGGFAVAGSSHTNSNGFEDMWYVRLDAAGEVLFERVYGSPQVDQADALAALPDGGFVLAGVTQLPNGQSDLWLLRIDAAGEPVWDRKFDAGSGSADNAYDVVGLADGGLGVVGRTASKGAGGYDAWLLRLDGEGDLLWDRTFSGPNGDVGEPDQDIGYALALLPGGGFAIAGETLHVGPPPVYQDAWILVVSDSTPCGDGEPCNGAEECLAGVCASPEPLDCDDDNDCTVDSCAVGVGCTHVDLVSGETCEDGDLCTEGDACAAGVCGSGVFCDDDNECTSDACNPAVGCSYTNVSNGLPCDDGDPCHGPDACQGGTCVGPAIGLSEVLSGGAKDEALEDLALHAGGGAVAAGWATSESGDENGWLVKVEPSGDGWAYAGGTLFGGSKADRLLSVAILPGEGVVAAGRTQSKGAGGNDLWVLHVPSLEDGVTPVFETTLGGTADDRANAIVRLDDGGFAVAGRTASSSPFALGLDDGWLVRLDAEGEVLWNRRFGGNKGDELFALDVLPAGGYVLAGQTASKGAGGNDLWVLRTDADGVVQWEKTFGGALSDTGRSVLALPVVPDGGVIAIAGATSSKGAGGSDGWLLTVDGAGALLLDETYGGTGSDFFFDLVRLHDGFALSGSSTSKSAGGFDVWLARTDSSGNLLWQALHGGAKADEARAMAHLPGDGFAIGGSTSSKGAGLNDAWVLRIAPGPSCADGDPCDGVEGCLGGFCVAKTAGCHDGNPCTDDACVPAGGACTHDPVADLTPCDDGSPCTTDDACAAGLCAAGASDLSTIYDGPSKDIGRAIAALPDGYAIAGSTNAQGPGAFDVWLVRTDLDGAVLWDRVYGSGGNDYGHSLAVAPEGGFLLAGETDPNGNGQVDAWLVRTDAEGEALWDRAYGGSGTSTALGVVAVSDGGFAFSGHTGSKGLGCSDLWLVRIDEDGDVVWDVTSGTASCDGGGPVVALPDGGFATAGHIPSSGASNEFHVVRTDEDGAIVWTATFGGPQNDVPEAIALLPDGGLAVAGNSGPQDFQPGTTNVRVVRTDADGGLVWDRFYGGPGSEIAEGVLVLPGGGLALAGHKAEIGGDSYGWLLRTDAGGALLWERTFAGATRRFHAIASRSGGGVVLAGVTDPPSGTYESALWIVVTTDASSCSDDEPCNGAEECVEGACAVLLPDPCEDGDDCTSEACHPVAGCDFAPAADGTPCEEGTPCLGLGSCEDGGCTGGAPVLDAAFGGGLNEDAFGLAAHPDGGYVLTGYTASDTIGPVGDRDLMLVRTSESGALLWEKTFGGSSVEDGHEVIALGDGGVAVVGTTFSKGAGNQDGWFLRTDAGGDLVSDVTFGGEGGDSLQDLEVLPDGGFAFLGWTTSKGAGNQDFWLVRTDAADDVVLDRTYGGSGTDSGGPLVVLSDGGFALAGRTESKGAGAYDFWLVRTDAGGEPLWDRTYGSIEGEEAQAIALLADGGFVLIGFTHFAASQDVWLVRTDSSGEVLWDRRYGGGTGDIGSNVLALEDGGFAFAASTQSFGAGGQDFWLVRTDSLGEVLWDRTFGAAASEEPRGLVARKDGGFALAGYTYSKGAGGSDFWLVLTTDSEPCGDGEACGAVEECVEGACTGSFADPCDDGNDCTLDACDPTVGCAHEDAADDTPCDDGGPCTGPGLCAAGACVAGPEGFEGTYGGAAGEFGHALADLPDGGYALAGYTDSKGAGLTDFWLVRTDADGETVWDRTYGGSNYDDARAVEHLPSGDLVLAGRTASKGAGGNDFWLVRTDADGDLLWDRTFGGLVSDEAEAVAVLDGGEGPEGGFAVAGYTQSIGSGNQDFWLVRTDANGDLLWNRTYGAGSSEIAYAVAALSEGGFAIAGHTTSKGAGGQDLWLVRTDAEGEPLWDETFGGSANDSANALAELPDGGFVVTGSTLSKGAGNQDMWLVRTDAEGLILWDRTFGGSQNDVAHALDVRPDGGFVLAGSTSSKGAGGTDAWLVRTDDAGDLVWDRAFGSFANEEARGLAPRTGGGFATAGFTGGEMWLVVTSDGTPCGPDASVCAAPSECAAGACFEVSPATCE